MSHLQSGTTGRSCQVNVIIAAKLSPPLLDDGERLSVRSHFFAPWSLRVRFMVAGLPSDSETAY
jgi:hypothetical protein